VSRPFRSAHFEHRHHGSDVFGYTKVVAARVAKVAVVDQIPQPALPGAYGGPEPRRTTKIGGAGSIRGPPSVALTVERCIRRPASIGQPATRLSIGFMDDPQRFRIREPIVAIQHHNHVVRSSAAAVDGANEVDHGILPLAIALEVDASIPARGVHRCTKRFIAAWIHGDVSMPLLERLDSQRGQTGCDVVFARTAIDDDSEHDQ